MSSHPLIRVSIGPDYPARNLPVHHALSVALELQNSGKAHLAGAVYDAILAVVPDQFDALHLSGVLAQQQGQFAAAEARISRAVKLNPESADAHSNLSVSLHSLSRYTEAERAATLALRLNPQLPQAHSALAAAALAQDKLAVAIKAYTTSFNLSPNQPQTLVNLAAVALKLGRTQQALDWVNQAIELDTGGRYSAQAQFCLGAIEIACGNSAAGLASLESGRAAMSDSAEWWYQRSIALEELRRWDEALSSAEQALALRTQGESEGGVALGANLSDVMFLRRRLCIWSDHDALLTRFKGALAQGVTGLKPFSFLCEPSTLAEQKRCAELWAEQVQARANRLRPPRYRGSVTGVATAGDSRIRVGYLSNGFGRHPTAALCVELFESHDLERFQVYAYSLGVNDNSQLRRRIENASGPFRDVASLSLEDLAQQIADDALHILVDLRGYGGGAVSEVLALRPAPIQVQYFAYPGTMGASFIDYMISDPFMTPAKYATGYTENLVTLPVRFQPNDTTRRLPADIPDRAACGLPPKGLVLCSFNNSYKIDAPLFNCWLRLLQSREDSVLWLLAPPRGSSVPDRLRGEAEAVGIAQGRIVFMPKLPHLEYLSRYRLADLFLDTHPYNAHTTASDALWAGCPVLTLAGETFASRVAGSLLTAAGLPELITYDLEAYERMALNLMGDASALRHAKAALVQARNGPLFDTPALARALETAYERMVDRLQSGRPPAPINLTTDPVAIRDQ